MKCKLRIFKYILIQMIQKNIIVCTRPRQRDYTFKFLIARDVQKRRRDVYTIIEKNGQARGSLYIIYPRGFQASCVGVCMYL